MSTDRQRAVFKMLFPDKCWHEQIVHIGEGEDTVIAGSSASCFHCGETEGTLHTSCPPNPDLTTWEGFGLMWEQAQKMEWCRWTPAQDECHIEFYDARHTYCIGAIDINPQRFLDALYDFGVETGRING